uniref:Uncharacterized protein n=1 Tax=Anolis carolinensis TaxID=28377 RepID=A0A803T8V9_ANOCA
MSANTLSIRQELLCFMQIYSELDSTNFNEAYSQICFTAGLEIHNLIRQPVAGGVGNPMPYTSHCPHCQEADHMGEA